MKDKQEFIKHFFSPQKRQTPTLSEDKRVLIKHKGQRKIYRINKYGEIFEQK